MAEITPTTTKHGAGTHVVKWEGIGQGDTCLPVRFSGARDKTVQAVGTFTGTPTVTLEGSNMIDVVEASRTYAGLTQLDATNAISFSAAGMEGVIENPAFIKPVIASGDGSTDIDVYLLCGRSI